MRVLAVAQRLRPLEVQAQRSREQSLLGVLRPPPSGTGVVEPGDDLGVVGRGAGERGPGEPAARRPGQAPAGAQLGEHRFVLGGIDDDADVGMVLRRGPHHRRPADVDQLDPRLLAERVQVDDHEGDRLDAELLEVTSMVGIVGVGQDAAVHLRVQRDHSMAEDGREARALGDVGDRNPRLGDRSGGPAARQQIPPQVVQAASELDDPGLVVDGQQGGGHRAEGNERLVGRSSPRPNTGTTVRARVGGPHDRQEAQVVDSASSGRATGCSSPAASPCSSSASPSAGPRSRAPV